MAAGCAALFVFADSEEFSLNFGDAKFTLSRRSFGRTEPLRV
jgi:hypothetical protein